MIDLSLLSAPNVQEPLDFEAVLLRLKSWFLAQLPADKQSAVAATLGLESEPLTILLETLAYHELTIRARINDAARSVMLAYATSTDLDQLGANYDCARLAGESDACYRPRIQQAFHRLAAAGPANAYRQHALAVSTDITDVAVWSEAAGQVTVAVLAKELLPLTDLADTEVIAGKALFGAGPDNTHAYAVAASDCGPLRKVLAALNAEDIRPLTDSVIVRAPTIKPYSVRAAIEVLPGPDPDLIRTRRAAALNEHLAALQHMGYDVTRAGIIAALVESGVKNVRLDTPDSDIACGHGELAVCTGIKLDAEVVNV